MNEEIDPSLDDFGDDDLLAELEALQNSLQPTNVNRTKTTAAKSTPKAQKDDFEMDNDFEDDPELQRELEQLIAGTKKGSGAPVKVSSSASSLQSTATNRVAVSSTSASARVASSQPPPKKSLPPPKPLDNFQLLENAIKEAIHLLSISAADKSKDSEYKQRKLNLIKQYTQELNVLQSRRTIPGAQAALFHWETNVSNIKKENLDIGEFQLRLSVVNASGLLSSLGNESSRSVTLSYDLGIPKDAPIKGKINGKIDESGVVAFNFTTVFSDIISRQKVLAQALCRKKSEFQLHLSRGIFYGQLLLGVAVLPLTDLLSKCRVGGKLTLSKDDDHGKKRAMGGTLEIYVDVRTPLVGGPEVVVEEERVLVIEPWPVPGSNTAPPRVANSISSNTPAQLATSSSSSSSSTSTTIATSATGQTRVAGTTTTSSAAVASRVAQPTGGNAAAQTGAKSPSATNSTSSRFNTLTDLEKNDPLCVALLISNDVLDDEKQQLEEKLSSSSSSPSSSSRKLLSETDRSDLMMRLDTVSGKLAMLVQLVQEEKVSLEQYIAMVKERLAKDQLLLEYVQSLNNEDKLPEWEIALRRRISLMINEIKGVEEAGEE